MARATFVKAARKDYPEHGIRKGESYYWWAFMSGGRGGVKRFSKSKPKASQLTQSEFWSAVYSLQETAEDMPSYDDIEGGDLDSVVDELQNILDDTQSKFDNLPENFQNGENGERLQARVEALEEVISTLESIDTNFDEPEVERQKGETEEEFEDRKESEIDQAKDERACEIWSEVQEALASISCE